MIAIENVRLFEEVQARTRDLPSRWSSRPRPSEVLQVISSSPGELEPVFEAMLENATRICEAKFGNCCCYDGDAFRTVALHTTRRRPMPRLAAARGPVSRRRRHALGRVVADKAGGPHRR